MKAIIIRCLTEQIFSSNPFFYIFLPLPTLPHYTFVFLFRDNFPRFSYPFFSLSLFPAASPPPLDLLFLFLLFNVFIANSYKLGQHRRSTQILLQTQLVLITLLLLKNFSEFNLLLSYLNRNLSMLIKPG